MMTRDQLLKDQAELEEKRQQLTNQLNAVLGALNYIGLVLEREETKATEATTAVTEDTDVQTA